MDSTTQNAYFFSLSSHIIKHTPESTFKLEIILRLLQLCLCPLRKNKQHYILLLLTVFNATSTSSLAFACSIVFFFPCVQKIIIPLIIMCIPSENGITFFLINRMYRLYFVGDNHYFCIG